MMYWGTRRKTIQMSRWGASHQTRKETGFRSLLEKQVAEQLERLGVGFDYEKRKVGYVVPAESKVYTPDFELSNGVIVETKGAFESNDRKKHLFIKQQHPELDIRFVFSNPNQRISKKSKTTYAMWADTHGFKYSKGFIPKEWLVEKREKVA